MKIIHTSDWHLGQQLFDYDRSEEQRDFLRQLRDWVAAEQPDVLLVSGDVFHYCSPSASAQRLYTDALVDLHETCPSMQIVITAGNHDSSSKLEISRNLWKYAGVTVVGSICRNEAGEVDLERHLVEVKDGNGKPKGYVVALPHVYPQNFPSLDEEVPREDRQRFFIQTLLDRVAERNTAHLPVVLMAHLAVTGSDITGQDDGRGGMDYTDIRLMGEGYDYLALGHIHFPQTLPGGRARYCGSPLPVSFDESYGHSVSVVELAAHGVMPEVRTLPVRNLWPLKVLPAQAVPLEEALDVLKALPDEEKLYVQLHVRIQDVPPAYCMERAYELTRGKQCRFCRYKWERETAETAEETAELDVDRLQTFSPLQVAAIYYRDKFQHDISPEMLDLLEEAVKRVQTQEEE